MAITRLNTNAFGTSVNLASNVTGALPVANGGTGLTSGTTDQFLKFTGSTTLASAADNGGGMVLLTSGEITSTTSTIEITGTHVTSAHDHYRLYVRGKAAGDGIEFLTRYRNSSNNGLITSGYAWRVHADADNGAGSNNNGDSSIRLTNQAYLGNNSNEGFNMIIDFMSPLSNLVPTCMNWWIGSANTSDAWQAQRGMGRRNDGTETHTGFTLFFASGGDFANGTNYEFYGLAK